MTSSIRGSVARDSAWLLGGQAAGLLVTFAATPIELERMGSERYGIVVAVVGVVGSFTFLEVGSSWALMRFVPWYQARDDENHARRLASAGLAITSALGILGSIAIYLLAPPIAGMFELAQHEQETARTALRVMAFYLPVMIVGATLSGIARGLGLFRFMAIQVALSVIFINAVWVAVAGTRHDVAIVVAAHVVMGALSVAAWVFVIQRAGFSLSLSLDRPAMGELARFGGPAASSQMSFGLVTQLDKPVIGSVLPVDSLPSYAIPFGFAIRIITLSSSLASAIFPRVAGESSAGQSERVAQLALGSLRIVAIGGGAVTVGAVTAGKPFLELWVSHEFAAMAAVPLATLCLGCSVMAYGSIGQLLLDSQGRVGITALVTAVGGILGLAAGVLLAAVSGSPTGASIGIAAGLAIIGVLGIEFARRLAVPMSFLVAWRPLLATWFPLAVTGVVAATLASIVGGNPASRMLVPLTLIAGVACWLSVRARGLQRSASVD